MSEDKRYNGWANYETWVTALWIDNEPNTYHERVRMSQDAYNATDEDQPHEDRLAEAASDFAHSIQSWVSDMMPDTGASLASDLLGAALSEGVRRSSL